MNKQAQNKATQKFPMIWILAAGALIVGLSGWVAFNHYQKTQDRARFEKTKVVRDEVVAAIMQKVDLNAVSNTSEECYLSEYGPYSEGKTWCKVTSVTDLSGVAAERSEILVQINNVINSLGLKPSNKRSADIEFKSAGDIPCVVDLFDGAPMKLEVTCSDRAKANHYQFTE